MPDKTQIFSTMPTRQKIVVGLIALVLIFVVWQVVGLFGGNKSSGSASANSTVAGAPQQSVIPPPQALANLPKPKILSPTEAQLLRLQQETQAKYIAALNELQMLKVERDIADNQREIMKAKQDTVSAQKNIVDMLAPNGTSATHASYAKTLEPSTGANQPGIGAQSAGGGLIATEVKYTVISVSQLQHRWNAVLGFQGNLYSIRVGDVLAPDNSKVVSISRSGVVLEKDGVRKVISLVPVI
jgi:hypothetical protein